MSYAIIWKAGFYSLQKNKRPETVPIIILICFKTLLPIDNL